MPHVVTTRRRPHLSAGCRGGPAKGSAHLEAFERLAGDVGDDLEVLVQVQYLQATLALGESADPEKIDSLTLGVYAARKFETSDPAFAEVLFKVHYLAARMP